ncbi:LysR family transcriptional regulator [Nocardia sp. NPDC004168]|uniref:LysR family transcriptional regulator n=1 Tax=Nocardia sp. NPDC004168 TaxID=3154452 RepID=UPI0033B2C4C6
MPQRQQDHRAAGDQSEPVSDIFPWDSLQFFLELARKRTLARAARRLGVSHTTVLRQIAKLERSLDIKLFERDSSGFTLTLAGDELLSRAMMMEQAADEIFRSSKATDRLAGPVRIAAIEGLATHVLAPAFVGFHRQYPEIGIEINSMMQAANINLREADISVGPAKLTGPRITTRHLAACPIHLFAARSYLERVGTPSTLEDLDAHHFVDYVEDLVELPELRWFRETVGSRAVVFRSTSPMVQLEAVRHGMGIGMFPDYLASDDPQLCVVLPQAVSAERRFWLSIHAELWRVPRMEITSRFLAVTLARHFGLHDIHNMGLQKTPADNAH